MSATSRRRSSRLAGPATFIDANAVVTGVTWTRHSGCSVCNQLWTHSHTVAAPDDVVDMT